MQKRNLLLGVGGSGGVLAVIAGLVAGFEGNPTDKNGVSPAYQDIGGVWTVCYGETRGVKRGDKYTLPECNNMLFKSLLRHNKPFEALDNDIPVNVHIALLDWTYNVGVGNATSSTLWKHLRVGNYDKACAELTKWRFVKEKDCSIKKNNCSGVWKRRQLEQKICYGTITPHDAMKQLGSKPMNPDGATL